MSHSYTSPQLQSSTPAGAAPEPSEQELDDIESIYGGAASSTTSSAFYSDEGAGPGPMTSTPAPRPHFQGVATHPGMTPVHNAMPGGHGVMHPSGMPPPGMPQRSMVYPMGPNTAPNFQGYYQNQAPPQQWQGAPQSPGPYGP